MSRLSRLIAIVLVSLPFATGGAAAMEFDCGPLLKRAEAVGEAPDVRIDAKEGYVFMETSFGSCRESVGKRRFEATKKAVEPDRPERCSRRVAEVWEGGYHTIADSRYWLEQVFTVDSDRDGMTDNIGFTLVTMKDDQAVRAIAYYRGGEGLQAESVAGLALPTGVRMGDICFGRAAFAAPVEDPKVKPFKAFEVPDLREQLEHRAEQRQTASVRKAESAGNALLDLPVWMWALCGSTAAVGGSLLVFRHRRRKALERKLFGEDEDDDDTDV